jgi:hypothetical protein
MTDLREEQHHRWYAEVAARMRDVVRDATPAGARVAVISKGDDTLLAFDGREGRHFPETETGLFAGHHPADGADALAYLERVRARGAQFLVIPASATWWLDHYGELREHLAANAELVADDESCLVYALGDAAPAPAPAAPAGDLAAAQVAPPVSAWLRALLPADARVAIVGPVAHAVDLGERPTWRLAEPDADQLDAALAAGAQYVVLLGGRGFEPLRPAVAARGRLVAGQALADVFQVRPARAARPAPRPAPRRRRSFRDLFRDPLGRPDA